MTQGWEHFPHGADIGVRGRGGTREAAFENAALALTAVVTDLERLGEPRERVEIECSSPDPEILLVEWLDAIVFEMATRRLLFGRFAVRIDGDRLRGEAWGEEIDVERHRPAAEVKGATLTCLRVGEESPGTWVAQCVVDV